MCWVNDMKNIYHDNEAGLLVAHKLWSKPTIRKHCLSERRMVIGNHNKNMNAENLQDCSFSDIRKFSLMYNQCTKKAYKIKRGRADSIGLSFLM